MRTILIVTCFSVLFAATQSNVLEDDASFLCPEPNGIFPHETRCDLYYMCFANDYIIERCPDGELFDFLYERCLFAEDTDCGGRLLPIDDKNQKEEIISPWIALGYASNDALKNFRNATHFANETYFDYWMNTTSFYGNWTNFSNKTDYNNWINTTSEYGNWTNLSNETDYWMNTTSEYGNWTDFANETDYWMNTTSDYGNWTNFANETDYWMNTTSEYGNWTDFANETDYWMNTTSDYGNWTDFANETDYWMNTTSEYGNWTDFANETDYWMNTTSDYGNWTNFANETDDDYWMNRTSTSGYTDDNWSNSTGRSNFTASNSWENQTSTTLLTTEELITDEPEVSCPEKSGVFPHPTDPNRYIYCEYGYAKVYRCDINNVFNTEFSVCLPSDFESKK